MNKEHLLPIEKSRLGVIGGSGFYSMDQIEYLRELEINTPYGKPSDSIKVYNLGNLEIAFIPRHGRTHRLNPSEIPYKANIWAQIFALYGISEGFNLCVLPCLGMNAISKFPRLYTFIESEGLP